MKKLDVLTSSSTMDQYGLTPFEFPLLNEEHKDRNIDDWHRSRFFIAELIWNLDAEIGWPLNHRGHSHRFTPNQHDPISDSNVCDFGAHHGDIASSFQSKRAGALFECVSAVDDTHRNHNILEIQPNSHHSDICLIRCWFAEWLSSPVQCLQ